MSIMEKPGRGKWKEWSGSSRGSRVFSQGKEEDHDVGCKAKISSLRACTY